jgi:acetyl esterase/lipase
MRALTTAMSWWTPSDIDTVALTSDVTVRLHRRPAGAQRGPALLWLHGGGYVMGNAAQDDRLCRRYVRALGATVAAPNYRLAPEHPYPTPLEDCYRALVWLAGRSDVDPGRIVIGGASGGGGLAAALALLARDRGEIAAAAQLLVYPMLDDRTSTGATAINTGHRMWDHASNRWAWGAYLGHTDPERVVPARAADLSGLPPTWIGVGSFDLFHDEDVEYAGRLATAGVNCHLEVVPGAYHSFDALQPNAAVSRRFFANQCAVISEALKHDDNGS